MRFTKPTTFFLMVFAVLLVGCSAKYEQTYRFNYTFDKDQEPLKGVHPGQPIRFEPVESRFEPLTTEGWTQTFYAASMDFGGGVPG